MKITLLIEGGEVDELILFETPASTLPKELLKAQLPHGRVCCPTIRNGGNTEQKENRYKVVVVALSRKA
jgi:hypothetical protein